MGNIFTLLAMISPRQENGKLRHGMHAKPAVETEDESCEFSNGESRGQG